MEKSNGSEVTEELEKLCGLATERDPRFAGLHTVVISDGVKTVTGRDIERHNAALDEFARIPEYKVCAVRLEKIAEDSREKADGMEG